MKNKIDFTTNDEILKRLEFINDNIECDNCPLDGKECEEYEDEVLSKPCTDLHNTIIMLKMLNDKYAK